MSEFGHEYGGGAGWGGNAYGGMDAMGMGGGMGFGGMDAGFIADAGGQTQSGKKESKYKDKMLVAVSVKQILQAEAADSGDSVKIDGQTPSTVKICGTIESVEKHTTQIVYMINDTTGTIKCVHYIEKEEGESATKFADCKEGSFVRVVGVARNPQTDPNILVYNMGVVTDFNEVTYHMLEVIYCHNYALKGPPPGAAAAAAKNYNYGMGSLGGVRAPITPGPGRAGGQAVTMDAGNSSVKDAVLDALRKITLGMDQGTTVEDIHSYLQNQQSRVSKDEVSKCVQNMSDEGTIYSTVDENHFMCTE